MKKKQSVDVLYAKYGPAIFSRCKRLLKNTSAAEDATQDVFLKVINHLEAAPADALPWIYRITTNHCLNVLRDARRHASPVEQVPEQIDDEFEETMVRRNFSARALEQAPEELRAPAMMYHGCGIEQAKVAEALGVSRRTVLYRLAEFTRQVMELNTLAEAGEA
jgi:RNA polymerase sigma-70 factor, ECF subfamily